MDWHEISSTTWGAVQGSIAVLLIMGYGYVARSRGLLTQTGERNIFTLITKVFLPALLFKGIGPSATASIIVQYWTIILWALVVQAISYLYALLCIKLGIFKSGLWTGACMFNNTISLPLLMLQSLGRAGAFGGIVGQGNTDDAIRRAQTYFLVNALVNHLTSYIFGPQIMLPNTSSDSKSSSPRSSTSNIRTDSDYRPEGGFSATDDERTRLLPGPPQEYRRLHAFWGKLKGFMNPPLLGGLAAIVVGIIPILHAMFLDDGGLFRGSLTQSIYNIGDLYTAIQMLVVGAQLSSSSQQRHDGVHVSKTSLLALFFLRFVLMPVISISFVYGLRSRLPHLIPHDPMFDYSLMMVPVGPPAIHLAAIAELAKLSEGEKGVLSKVLMLSYVVTPFISVPIAASLAVVKSEGIVYQGP